MPSRGPRPTCRLRWEQIIPSPPGGKDRPVCWHRAQHDSGACTPPGSHPPIWHTPKPSRSTPGMPKCHQLLPASSSHGLRGHRLTPPTKWENYRSADSDAEVCEAPSTGIGVEGLQDPLARANSDQVTLTKLALITKHRPNKTPKHMRIWSSSGPTSRPTSTKGDKPASLAPQTSQLMS